MIQRRRTLQLLASSAALALPALQLSGQAWAQPQPPAGPLRLTPAQSEGPFYPDPLPADRDADLLANGALRYARGEAAWVEGTLTDPTGRAVPGAVVEIWQCDHDGHYHHPRDGGRADPAFQGFGRSTVDAEGRWRFRTLMPAPYTGRTPHIHAKVWLGRRELLTTQLYVEGEVRNERDFLWRRLAAEDRALITAPYRPTPRGRQAVYALVVVA